MLLEVIPRFDGKSTPIREWRTKFEIIAGCQGISNPKEWANIMPLFLEGAVFKIYENIDEKQRSYEQVMSILTKAFDVDEFGAFEQLQLGPN